MPTVVALVTCALLLLPQQLGRDARVWWRLQASGVCSHLHRNGTINAQGLPCALMMHVHVGGCPLVPICLVTVTAPVACKALKGVYPLDYCGDKLFS